MRLVSRLRLAGTYYAVLACFLFTLVNLICRLVLNACWRLDRRLKIFLRLDYLKFLQGVRKQIYKSVEYDPLRTL